MNLKKFIFIFAAVLAIAVATSASADVTTTYNLVGVSFADGGTATGVITVDYPSAGGYGSAISWEITITDPSYPIQPLVLTPANSVGGFDTAVLGYNCPPEFIIQYPFTDTTYYLTVNVAIALLSGPTNGPVQLVLSNCNSGYAAPVTAILEDLRTSYATYSTVGALDPTPQPTAASVPALTPFAMFLLIVLLAGLGVFNRKFKA